MEYRRFTPCCDQPVPNYSFATEVVCFEEPHLCLVSFAIDLKLPPVPIEFAFGNLTLVYVHEFIQLCLLKIKLFAYVLRKILEHYNPSESIQVILDIVVFMAFIIKPFIFLTVLKSV